MVSLFALLCVAPARAGQVDEKWDGPYLPPQEEAKDAPKWDGPSLPPADDYNDPKGDTSVPWASPYKPKGGEDSGKGRFAPPAEKYEAGRKWNGGSVPPADEYGSNDKLKGASVPPAEAYDPNDKWNGGATPPSEDRQEDFSKNDKWNGGAVPPADEYGSNDKWNGGSVPPAEAYDPNDKWNGGSVPPADEYGSNDKWNGGSVPPAEAYDPNDKWNGGSVPPADEYANDKKWKGPAFPEAPPSIVKTKSPSSILPPTQDTQDPWASSYKPKGGEDSGKGRFAPPAEKYEAGHKWNGGAMPPADEYGSNDKWNGGSVAPSEDRQEDFSKNDKNDKWNGGSVPPVEAYDPNDKWNGGSVPPVVEHAHDNKWQGPSVPVSPEKPVLQTAIPQIPPLVNRKPALAAPSAPPASVLQAKVDAAFVEKEPRSIDSYVKELKSPKYIRVNVTGYNVRTSPDFDSNNKGNIAFETTAGRLFEVVRTVPLQRGVATAIRHYGQELWILVPYERKNTFQFCESVACFSDLTESLDLLAKVSNMSRESIVSCGIVGANPAAEEKKGLPRQVEEVKPVTVPRPVVPRPVAPTPPPREISSLPPSAAPPARLQTTPLWERAKPGPGYAWTKMLSDSLDKHGQGLLNLRYFHDQNYFCPKYSRLSPSQRKEFWMHLMNSVARYESNFNLKATFDERHHRGVSRGRVNPHTFSQGMFQLSYESAAARRYKPFCHFSYSRDRYKDISDPSLTIYDPKKQMDCAVGIMNQWVSQDRALGLSVRGGARFWSTLRSSNPSTRLVRATLRRFAACW